MQWMHRIHRNNWQRMRSMTLRGLSAAFFWYSCMRLCIDSPLARCIQCRNHGIVRRRKSWNQRNNLTSRIEHTKNSRDSKTSHQDTRNIAIQWEKPLLMRGKNTSCKYWNKLERRGRKNNIKQMNDHMYWYYYLSLIIFTMASCVCRWRRRESREVKPCLASARNDASRFGIVLECMQVICRCAVWICSSSARSTAAWAC